MERIKAWKCSTGAVRESDDDALAIENEKRWKERIEGIKKIESFGICPFAGFGDRALRTVIQHLLEVAQVIQEIPLYVLPPAGKAEEGDR